MSEVYATEEIKKILDDPNLFLRAVDDCTKIYPGLKPTAIAKMLDDYRSRLKDAFGIED